jgi:diguanylate cyclase (GGDEF)-like protein/PAS domain S-box-containing protein
MTLQAKFFAVVASALLLAAVCTGIWCHYRQLDLPREMVCIAAIVVAVVLVTVSTAAWWWVGKPLRRMSGDMERIARGQDCLHPLVEAGRADELGMAARAFNQVVDATQWVTTALQAANNELERRVANRTQELQRNSQREITEARESQARIAVAEQKYRAIFENATEGIFQTTLDGRCISANPAMVRMLGYDSAEQIKTMLTDLGTQLYTDTAQRKQFLDKLIRDGRIDQFASEVYCRDGRRIWISISARVVQNSDSEIPFVEGTVRDVTAQRQAEAELRRSEAEARKLALVASRTHNPVLITDAQGHLEWANAAFTELTGYTLEDIRGRTPGSMLQGPDTDPETIQQMRKSIAAAQPFKVELVNYSRSGRRYWLSIDAEPVKNSVGIVQKYIAIQEDITEQKRSEWLEQDRRSLLEMVARNEALTTTLQAICRAAERQCEQVQGAIVLYEDDRKYTAAAPLLPHDVVKEMDAALISIDGLSLARPAGREQSLAIDLETDERLAALRNATNHAGITGRSAVTIYAGNGTPLGEFILFHTRIAAIPDNDQKILLSLAGLAGLAIEHHQLTHRLSFQAKHDSLTGLPNRSELDTQLPLWVASAARQKLTMAVMMVDLDGFKHVNDTLGHAEGDALLRQVAQRLKKASRASDVLARTGGDEFTLVATELRSEIDGMRVAQRLIDALSVPCDLNGRELFITSSIGLAVFSTDGVDAATLQRNADSAMYAAKAAGRNQAKRYDPQMSVAAVERLELEGQLRRALENEELHLHYQPQVNRNETVVGVEALLRWNHPKMGRISPARFIPVAEQSGLIVPIGTWVLNEACRQAKTWQQAGCPPVCVAVNVSAMQFQQAEFVNLVAACLAETELEPTLLELELTESMLLTNIEEVLKKLSALRLMGVNIAIDDFGTGYSSLAYLQKLPIDRLKIDQSFVRELTTVDTAGGSHTAVISAIVSLARSLGKGVVAEGVETAMQRDYLVDIGCGTLQGYLYSPPVSPEQIEKILLNRRIEPVKVAISA